MKIKYLIIGLLFFFALPCSSYAEKKSWQTWPNHPKGLRISIDEIKSLLNQGEKITFIYSGYQGGEGSEIICGSLIIPYDKVPPSADGSRVKVKFSPDRWLLCY